MIIVQFIDYSPATISKRPSVFLLLRFHRKNNKFFDLHKKYELFSSQINIVKKFDEK